MRKVICLSQTEGFGSGDLPLIVPVRPSDRVARQAAQTRPGLLSADIRPAYRMPWGISAGRVPHNLSSPPGWNGMRKCISPLVRFDNCVRPKRGHHMPHVTPSIFSEVSSSNIMVVYTILTIINYGILKHMKYSFFFSVKYSHKKN